MLISDLIIVSNVELKIMYIINLPVNNSLKTDYLSIYSSSI